MSINNKIQFLDYGVKGQKRGQHVKARDPEYLARLKGGKISKVNQAESLSNNFKRTGKHHARARVLIGQSRGLNRSNENIVNRIKKMVEPPNKPDKNNSSKKPLSNYEYIKQRWHQQLPDQKYKSLGQEIERGLQSSKEIKNMAQQQLKEIEEIKKSADNRLKQRNYANKQAHYANVRNGLSSKAERPTGYKQKSMLRRIGNGLSKHKGKVALAGLGLAAIGGGLGYAKHRGAFDSNYNVLKFRRNDSMNINQKIQFLRNRRHMDALRIKRLRRRISDSPMNLPQALYRAKEIVKKIVNNDFKSKYAVREIDDMLRGAEKWSNKGDLKKALRNMEDAEFKLKEVFSDIQKYGRKPDIYEDLYLKSLLEKIYIGKADLKSRLM